MPRVLSPDERADRLQRAGYTIISHTLHDDAVEHGRTGSHQLTTDIGDGVYRIVQYRDDDTVADASLDLPPDVAAKTVLPMQMEVDPGLHTRLWRLTRQYGAENLFTIVPYHTPTNNPENSRIGATTLIEDDAICVGPSKYYPNWIIQCKARTPVKYSSGTSKTISHYMIGEAGGDQCWQTDDDEKITAGYAEGGLPPPPQLYELCPATSHEDVVVYSASGGISVMSPHATPVKKFYFGTDQLNGQKLSSFLSIQLETDAHDQGWATDPQRGLWSWFEIAIFRNLPGPDQIVTPDMIKPGPNGKPLTWLSHTLPLSREYHVQKGACFAKDHEIWKFVQSGDYIGVLACAQYAYWKAVARSGRLLVQEVLIDNETSSPQHGHQEQFTGIRTRLNALPH
ncbi:hypothetical protein FRC09_005435 [Ceratobasidium sp. 395]|nr:hypothetical protein FRC09_005435 [Ceratobasidium sp. 395]